MSVGGKVKHGLAYRNGPEENKIFCSKYHSIKNRCNHPEKNEKNKKYKGIQCEWDTLSDFKEDMYDSFIEHVNKFGLKNTQIDRIDPTKNYCKENCRRVTIEEQAYNKTNTATVIIDGVKYNSVSYAKKFGVPISIACSRISHYNSGTTTEETLRTYGMMTTDGRSKLQSKHHIIIGDKEYTLREIATEAGITLGAASQRYNLYKNGDISAEDLLFKGHRPTIKHTIFCDIDGIQYNKDTLVKEVGCNPVTAWTRIKKYNNGKITKEELFKKTTKKSNN